MEIIILSAGVSTAVQPEKGRCELQGVNRGNVGVGLQQGWEGRMAIAEIPLLII